MEDRQELGKAQRQVEVMLGERGRRETSWRELSRWLCPWRGKFEDNQYDRVWAEDVKRFTGAASGACLRGASGITSGMTPRNISWFKPVFFEEGLCEAPGARLWLDGLDLRMKDCLAEGGFYQAIHNFNLDLIWSGCGLLYCERGAATLQFECVQIGTFCLGARRDGSLSAVARRLRMTVGEAAEKFGEGRLGPETRARLREAPESGIFLWHLTRDAGGKIESLWWEDGGEGILSRGHYNEMPYFFTVWNEGPTIYGTGPGDECVADARQLDMLERYKLAGLGKLADPPLRASASLKDSLDTEPGGLNYMNPGDMLEPLLDLGAFAACMGHVREEIATITQRLENGLMASIFSSIPLDQRPADMSATEFLERKREALQQLGPIISAYEPNVLMPLLQRVTNVLNREGLLPPPPEALQGLPLAMKVEFISPMANALRQTGAETARAFFADVANIYQASQNPECLDKINLDQLIDELASGLGVPGGIVRSDEEVAAIRQQRARQEQQRQQLEMQQQQELMQLKQQEIAARARPAAEPGPERI